MMNYDTDDFERDVIERSHRIPVVVDFWAEWCGPCRVLGPTLEKLAEEQRDRWVLVKVDTERHPDVARRYGIQSIPHVKLFVDGRVVDEFVGALPEPMIQQWLKKALPSPYRSQLQEARRLLLAQKIEEAHALLKDIVEAEPDNDQAVVLLAQTLLYDHPQEAVDLVSRIEPGSEVYDVAEATRTFGTLFQYLEQPDALPDGPYKETYLQAIRHLHEGRFEEALQGFIEVIRHDRAYHDEGARRACIAIFKSLGEEHPLTREYRRAFSSALYV